MKKVLFVTYGGGHMKIIEPIAKELLKDKGIEFKILGLTSAYKYLLNSFNGDIVKNLSDYSFLFDDIIDEVLGYGLEHLDKNFTQNNVVTKEHIIFYIGLSFYDLVERKGKKEAYKLYKNKKRQSFLPISIINKILLHESIDIVVATTSPRFEQASFIAANNLGIETVEILDLFSQLYPLPEANNIVVMNKSIQQGLINQNLQNKRYHILGQPAIEKTQEKVASIKPLEIKNKLNLINDITICFITQKMVQFCKDVSIGEDIEYKYILSNLFNIANILNDKYKVNIILRIHPNEDINEYKEYLQKYNFLKLINDDLDLSETIAISDIFVLHSSTVGVEAIVSDKIVFTYKHEQDINYPFVEMQQPPFIFSDGFKELEKNICKYIDNPTKQNKIEKFMPKNSAKNIAKLIKDL